MIIRDTFLAIASTISGNLLLPQNSLPPLSSVLEKSLASQLFSSINLNYYLVGGVNLSLSHLKISWQTATPPSIIHVLLRAICYISRLKVGAFVGRQKHEPMSI